MQQDVGRSLLAVELQCGNGPCVSALEARDYKLMNRSFLTGCLPLSFGLSQNHTRIVSALGTGLLVGACLIIIIPEGIETLYSAHGEPEQEAEGHREPHAYVGLSLIIGFILMFIIDQLPKLIPMKYPRRQPLHISLANLSQGPHHEGLDHNAGEASESFLNYFTLEKSATTIGLVIHATADGIALAASSFMSTTSTGLIVFLALMIHKAPAAFGLTSVLLKQGLSKREAKAHLLVFSLAAPVGAIGTWILVNLAVGGQIQSEETMKFATGVLLLFSGGTFL